MLNNIPRRYQSLSLSCLGYSELQQHVNVTSMAPSMISILIIMHYHDVCWRQTHVLPSHLCLRPSISLLVSSCTKDTIQTQPQTPHRCVLTGVDGDCTTGGDGPIPPNRVDFPREGRAPGVLRGEPSSVRTICLHCSLTTVSCAPMDAAAAAAVPRGFGGMVL